MNNKNIIIEISAADCALPRVWPPAHGLFAQVCDFLRKFVVFVACEVTWNAGAASSLCLGFRVQFRGEGLEFGLGLFSFEVRCRRREGQDSR